MSTQISEPDPITEIRFPLMILFLTAATFSFLLELPAWVTIPAGAILGTIWSVAKAKPLIIALSKNWHSHWVWISPVVALFVYVLVDISIQLVTSSVIDNGGLQPGKELPTIFHWLLSLRAAQGNLPPILMGIAGGILLGIGEEIFWRGFILTRLMMFVSHGAAALTTSVLYGVFYFLALGPMGALFAVFLGIILAMFTLRSKSLLPAILCHMTLLVTTLWIQPDLSSFI